MSKHYTEDVRAGGPTQIHPNNDTGGILWFDCNEVIAECGPEESHQLHLTRPLTDDEHDQFDNLLGGHGPCMYNDDGDRWWIDCGVCTCSAAAYLLSLRG